MNYFLVQDSHIMLAALSELTPPVQYNDGTVVDLKNSGSWACREVLFLLQKKLGLVKNNMKIALHEQHFPYTFKIAAQQYNVSFSHSCKQVAVMLYAPSLFTEITDTSRKSAVVIKFGIDVEDRMISDAVAKRFFCEQEYQWIMTLENSQKTLAKTLLWTLKESLIKAQVHGKLIAGLKVNLFDYLCEKQLTTLLAMTGSQCNQVITRTILFGFFPRLKCGFVIHNP